VNLRGAKRVGEPIAAGAQHFRAELKRSMHLEPGWTNRTIVGSTIFMKSDYWSSGSWTREVPIAQLDIPATLQANQARGARFSLPSRLGEVMMRP
jgi:hypothetical protein